MHLLVDDAQTAKWHRDQVGTKTEKSADRQNDVRHAVPEVHDQIVDRSDCIPAIVVDGRADDRGGPISGRQLNNVDPARGDRLDGPLGSQGVGGKRGGEHNRASGDRELYINLARYVSDSQRTGATRAAGAIVPFAANGILLIDIG
jgi:hypothetical protein